MATSRNNIVSSAWIRQGDRSHPDLVQLDALVLSYPGWQRDFEKAEKCHFEGNAFLFNFNDAMHSLVEKQKVHQGDRSHPRLIALDSLELTYPGWQADLKRAEDFHLDHAYNPAHGDRRFQLSYLDRMKKRQQAFRGDRTHPDLVKLDALDLSYPGWEQDFQMAEKCHFEGNHFLFSIEDSIHSLVEKQKVHEGDRSHSRLVVLDSLELNYPGWQEDFNLAEKFHLEHKYKPGLDHLFERNHVERLRKKQQVFSCGERTHPDLVKLDSLVLTYPNWQQDFEKAEKCHFDGSSFLSSFEDALHSLVEKQKVHEGDRSHPRLVAIDLLPLNYPGWRDDLDLAEKYHLDHSYNPASDYSFEHRYLERMKKKQQIFNGHQQANAPERRTATEQSQSTVEEDKPLVEGTEQGDSSSPRSALETCVICLEQPRTHAYVPCGHFSVCHTCGRDSVRQQTKCPVCRQDVREVMRVFFS